MGQPASFNLAADEPVKKFVVYGAVVGSKFLGVFEAETEEAAVEKALESDECFVSFCHQCSDNCEDPQIETATAEEAV